MKLYTSYNETFKATIASQRFAIAHLDQIRLPMNIDTSGCYKLFYFISGAQKFHIDSLVYDIQPGDLFFVNQREWHYFSQINNKNSHERIVIFIYPEYLKSLCTDQTDLCNCFVHKDNQRNHKLWLQPKEQERFFHFIHKISNCSGFGEDIITLSTFLELIVFVNKLHLKKKLQNIDKHELSPVGIDLNQSSSISPILSYINRHITEDLSLEQLSKQFFITPSYLCRLFKTETGTTILKYITAKRITLAKDLLAQGYSVTDTCNLSGFKDYNGFLKSFVNAVGLPPKKYAQLAIKGSAFDTLSSPPPLS